MNAAAKAADDVVGKKETAFPLKPDPSTLTMKAVVYKSKQKVAVETVPRPLITDPKDVIVRVAATTVCSGSDGHVYAGEIPGVDKDFIVGHESVGFVDEVGPEVKKFSKGDRVVITFNLACGECEYCKREQYTACARSNDSVLADKVYGKAHGGIFGYGRLLGGIPGTQAEYVRVPYGDINLFPIPDSVPFEKAVYVADVVSTGYHAVEMAGVSAGKSVVIWGMGPVGLCAARWAQILGASMIIGIEPVEDRAEFARKQLSIQVINPSDVESVPKAVAEILPEGADCCIEAAGFRFSMTLKHKVERAVGLESDASDILNETFVVAKKFGRVSLIADYVGYTNHFFIGAIQLKHLTVEGGQTPCQRVYPIVMPYIESGEFNPLFLVTNRVTFDELPDAYEKLFYKKDGWVKLLCMLDTSGSDTAMAAGATVGAATTHKRAPAAAGAAGAADAGGTGGRGMKRGRGEMMTADSTAFEADDSRDAVPSA